MNSKNPLPLSKQSETLSQKDVDLLSSYTPPHTLFANIEAAIETFRKPDFLNLTLRKRFKTINTTLSELILDTPPHAFSLRSVLDFFSRINQENILKEKIDLASFEFWLNHYSDFPDEKNYEIRARIVGKYLPRGEFQNFFPIGMGKIYFGTHFVTAHLSPDIDTMVASFSGWLDAFGARIGTGLHLWCLPGGPPDSPVTSYFRNLFGENIFSSVARAAPTLSLSAMDLVTQQSLAKEFGNTLINTLDHGPNEKAIILVNEKGEYIGDWRSSDVEVVRQIIILFKSCLHWFENNFHTRLISLFASADFSAKDLAEFNSDVFGIKIKECEPARDFNEKQQGYLGDFFSRVLEIKEGFECTFLHLSEAFHRLSIDGIFNLRHQVKTLNSLFNDQGVLKEERPHIFNDLKELFNRLDKAIHEVRDYVERLDVVMSIKHKVLKISSPYLTLQSDVEEIRQKMKGHSFLTVVIHEHDNSLFPVGIVRATDLREQGLGTVSLRDFCNLEEVRMAPYLDVISVVDHHKSSLKTLSVPTALIGDAQSCNVLIAEQTFLINDKYSLGGMTLEQIEKQIQEASSCLSEPESTRILQRLLHRRSAIHRNTPHYIHPGREFAEYLCFIQAILDDTDLLTKLSNRDVECTANLLNRLKSLSLGREVEIVQFDDIPRDNNFVRAAAKRILQQKDMYSLYKYIYNLRENEVEENLKLCADKEPSSVFLDTKEQNGCARIGQTKLFSCNFPVFLKKADDIRSIWLEQSQEVNRNKPEIDLYLQMISTIASAEEVYADQIGPYDHQDELWFWTPPTQAGWRHLNSFLAGFRHAAKNFVSGMSVEFLGSPPEEFIALFEIHFPEIPHMTKEGNISMAILRFKAGALNSRKSMVSPFLPRIV